MAGLGKNGEDVCPIDADVAEEMIVQITESSDVPTVPGRAGKMEDEGNQARHLSLLLIFPVLWKYRAKINQAAFSARVEHPASAQHSSTRKLMRPFIAG